MEENDIKQNDDLDKVTLRSEHLGISGDNFSARSVSAPRVTMDLKMQAQTPVLVKSDRNPILTGAEEALNLTYNVTVPDDGSVLKTITKFPHAVAHEFNTTLLIYQRMRDQAIDVINLPPYFFEHTEFGFPYKVQPAAVKINGGILRKGDVLLDSPNRKEDGSYGNGRMLNVIKLSHPAVGDDGIAISEDVVEMFGYYTFARHQFNVGENSILCNLYGTEDNPKCFPDIGEQVRPDGLLAAVRTFNERNAITAFTKKALRIVDENSDELTLVPTSSVVVDIDVIYNHNKRNSPFEGVHKQLDKYLQYIDDYYEKIKKYFEENIAIHPTRPDQGMRYRISDEFDREVRNAYARRSQGSFSRHYRRAPIKEYLVTITTMAICYPQIAAKLTGKGTADKGVITRILPVEEMPMTDDGVRAQMILSLDAPFGRMTLGAIREPDYNAVNHYFVEELRERYSIPKGKSAIEYQRLISTSFHSLVDDFSFFHEKFGAESLALWKSLDKNEHMSYMVDAFQTGLAEVFLPIDRKECDVERDKRIFEEILSEPPIRNLSFMYKGKLVKNKFPAVIGKRMIVLLEKTAQDVSASASSTMQVTGLVAHKSPTSDYGIRTPTITTRLGNSETRVISYCSTETYSDADETIQDPPGTMVAELISRNGSRRDHELCIKEILNAEKPGQIETLIDRSKNPFGTVRAVGVFNAIALAQGCRFIQEGNEDADV